MDINHLKDFEFIRSEHLKTSTPVKLTVLLKSGKQVPFKKYYSEVPSGEALSLLGSGDLLEISVNNQNASQQLQLKVGDKIIVHYN